MAEIRRSSPVCGFIFNAWHSLTYSARSSRRSRVSIFPIQEWGRFNNFASVRISSFLDLRHAFNQPIRALYGSE